MRGAVLYVKQAPHRDLRDNGHGVDIPEETALYGGEMSGEVNRAFSAYWHRR